MSFIRELGFTTIDRRDSAFGALARLESGDLVCGFNVGGGPEVTGGTDWARSSDEGATWRHEGTILAPAERGRQREVNTLRLSQIAGDRVAAYGQRNTVTDGVTKFGRVGVEAVFCVSTPGARGWSEARRVPFRYDCPLEISNPILELADGRWLAPATVLADERRLGEKVVTMESADHGETWGNEHTVLRDPAGENGFFEQKLIEYAPGKLLACAWAVKLGSYTDLDNHFALSDDGGRTRSEPKPLPTSGQTLTPLHLGGADFLFVYNQRRQPQGIRLALAELRAGSWRGAADEFLWTPKSSGASAKAGIDSFDDFRFGLPSLLRLSDSRFLAVFWNHDDGAFGVCCKRFELGG